MMAGKPRAIVLLIGIAACSSAASGDYDELAPASSNELTLEATNQNFYEATLYALIGSQRIRLGTVRSNAEETFTFRWTGPELRIEIQLISVGSYFTESMNVDRGDILQLVIEPDLDRRIPITRRR
jgi:hypothetical protein